MKTSEHDLKEELTQKLAFSTNPNALQTYLATERAVANGIPVAFAIHSAGVDSQSVKSYGAMRRSGQLERRFNMSIYKPLDVVWNLSDLPSAVLEDLERQHPENPAPTPVVPLGSSGVIAICVEGGEARKRWSRLAPFVGLDDAEPTLRWVCGKSIRDYFLLTLRPGFDVGALSRASTLWADESGGIFLMVQDCCVPIPFSEPSAGDVSESVVARGGDTLVATPIPKQLLYLLQTVNLESQSCKRSDSRAWKLQGSINDVLSGRLGSRSASVAQYVWATRANWSQILGRAGYEKCDEDYTSPCSDGCCFWRHSETGLVLFAHGPQCLESLDYGLALEAAAGRVPKKFRLIRRDWHEPKFNPSLGVDTLRFGAHEVATALLYGGDWRRFYIENGIQ